MDASVWRGTVYPKFANDGSGGNTHSPAAFVVAVESPKLSPVTLIDRTSS